LLSPKKIQLYAGGFAIRGRYGNGSEVRAGAIWYIVHTNI